MERKKLYIFKCKKSNIYKIGISVMPEERRKALQSSCPLELEIAYIHKTKHAERLEWFLHKLLKNKNLRYEWFDLSIDTINMLKREIPLLKLEDLKDIGSLPVEFF